MSYLKIAIFAGDGIGVEVTAEAVRVLDRVQQLDASVRLDYTHLPWGVELWRSDKRREQRDPQDAPREPAEPTRHHTRMKVMRDARAQALFSARVRESIRAAVAAVQPFLSPRDRAG